MVPTRTGHLKGGQRGPLWASKKRLGTWRSGWRSRRPRERLHWDLLLRLSGGAQSWGVPQAAWLQGRQPGGRLAPGEHPEPACCPPNQKMFVAKMSQGVPWARPQRKGLCPTTDITRSPPRHWQP